MASTKQRPLAERLWEKVVPQGPCWIFGGAHGGFGHGVIRREHHGRMAGAHRVAWELAYGPIPDGLFVCHTCDNPACVRLTHLFLGTAGDNAADMARKGRAGRTIKPESYGYFTGITNPSARLTPEIACQIRLRYAAGGVSQQALADEYGISQASVSAVVLGQTWRAAGLGL